MKYILHLYTCALYKPFSFCLNSQRALVIVTICEVNFCNDSACDGGRYLSANRCACSTI